MNILCKRVAVCATYVLCPALLTLFSGYVYSQCTRTITGPTVAQIIVLTGQTVCVNTDLLNTGDLEVEGGGTLIVGPGVRLVTGSITSYGRVIVGNGSYLYVQSGAMFDGAISSLTLNPRATSFVCNGLNMSNGATMLMSQGSVFDSFHSNFLGSTNYIRYVGSPGPAMRPYFISRASIILQGQLSNSAELGYCSQAPGSNLPAVRLGSAQNACTPVVPAVILQATHCNIISPFYYATVLPVRFEYFSANADGNFNQVVWSIEEDNTIEKYEVERGESSAVYTSIATFSPGTHEHIRYDYLYVDSLTNTKQSIYYYRVKAVRWNGTTFYSPVRRVQSRGTVDVLSISPNPVVRTLNVSLPADRRTAQPLQVDVVNAMGTTLYSEKVTSRRTFVTVPDGIISRMASGQYYVRVTTGERTYVSRFLKQ